MFSVTACSRLKIELHCCTDVWPAASVPLQTDTPSMSLFNLATHIKAELKWRVHTHTHCLCRWCLFGSAVRRYKQLRGSEVIEKHFRCSMKCSIVPLTAQSKILRHAHIDNGEISELLKQQAYYSDINLKIYYSVTIILSFIEHW